MSRISVTPQAAAEIALLRERIRKQEEQINRMRQAGNSLAVFAPPNAVKTWKISHLTTN